MSHPARRRLAVLGSPISHSRSPAIHRAAYAALGLDWTYDAEDVTGDRLAGYVRSRDSSWRGLSLTMPLKRDILPLLDSRDPLVDSTGAANTAIFTDDGIHGVNTDVYGVATSFRDAGITRLGYVHILGGGATAASVIAAVSQLGADRVVLSVRSPDTAGRLIDQGAELGVDVVVRRWGVMDRSLIVPDAVVSTVPAGTGELPFARAIREASILFDVSYDPWPSPLAAAWAEVGGTVISGLELLVNQAVGQVRIFTTGDAAAPLPDEPAIVAAMRAAVWKD